jgi:hypothetical protein
MGSPNSQVVWEPGQDSRAASEVDYHHEWSAFRFRRNLALFLLYGWVPACVGLFWWSQLSIHWPVTSAVAMAVWLVSALAAVWWAGEFRCPRCRRRYGALGHRKGDTNLTRGIFDKVCANCKLKKFEIIR